MRQSSTGNKVDIEILMPDGQWVTVTKEADVSPGWVRFHFTDGTVALAAPGRWRVKTT